MKYSIKSSNVAQDLVIYIYIFMDQWKKKTEKSFLAHLTVAPEVTFQ